MQKGSDFLNQLNRKIAASSSRYFYFTAEQDYLVKCPDACPDHDHTDSTLYKRHGHLSIMSSHRMVETIAGQIQALTQPTLTDSPEAAAAASIVSDTCTASTLPPSIRFGD